MAQKRIHQQLQYTLKSFSDIWSIDDELQPVDRLLLFLDKSKAHLLSRLNDMHTEVCKMDPQATDIQADQTLDSIQNERNRINKLFETLDEDLYALATTSGNDNEDGDEEVQQ